VKRIRSLTRATVLFAGIALVFAFGSSAGTLNTAVANAPGQPGIPLAPNSPDRANVVGPEGGSVVTPDGRVQVSVPAGALTAPAWVLRGF